MQEQSVYTIGEAAVVTGLSRKTLRYYDSIKLVVPAMRNPENNYRSYTKEQIIILCMVRRLRSMECSLEEIRQIIEEDNIETTLHLVEARMEKIREEIRYRENILHNSNEFIDRLRTACQLQKKDPDGEAFDTYLLTNMSLEEIPEMKLFSIRKHMENYNINDTSINFWTELQNQCEASGFNSSGTAIATYHNNLLEQFILKDCDLELGIRIDEDSTGATPSESAKDTAEKASSCGSVRSFGGFLAATAVYMGEYSNMINSYVSLLQWINRNGFEVCGIASEEYIIAPTESSDQKNQIIKIIIPVR